MWWKSIFPSLFYIDLFCIVNIYFLIIFNLAPLNEAGKPSIGLLSNAFSLADLEFALL